MYIYIIEEQLGTKICLSIGHKAVEFDSDEYWKFKYYRYVQKSYVPTPPRAPITMHTGTSSSSSRRTDRWVHFQ